MTEKKMKEIERLAIELYGEVDGKPTCEGRIFIAGFVACFKSERKKTQVLIEGSKSLIEHAKAHLEEYCRNQSILQYAANILAHVIDDLAQYQKGDE